VSGLGTAAADAVRAKERRVVMVMVKCNVAVCSDVIVKKDLGAVVGFVWVYIGLLDECSRKWR